MKNNLKQFTREKTTKANSNLIPQGENEGNDLVVQKLADRFLRKQDVIAITGLSASTIYRKEFEGLFPQRIRISARRIAWRLSDVNNWMLQKQTIPL